MPPPSPPTRKTTPTSVAAASIGKPSMDFAWPESERSQSHRVKIRRCRSQPAHRLKPRKGGGAAPAANKNTSFGANMTRRWTGLGRQQCREPTRMEGRWPMQPTIWSRKRTRIRAAGGEATRTPANRGWKGRSGWCTGAETALVKDAGRPRTLENAGPWTSGPERCRQRSTAKTTPDWSRIAVTTHKQGSSP